MVDLLVWHHPLIRSPLILRSWYMQAGVIIFFLRHLRCPNFDDFFWGWVTTHLLAISRFGFFTFQTFWGFWGAGGPSWEDTSRRTDKSRPWDGMGDAGTYNVVVCFWLLKTKHGRYPRDPGSPSENGFMEPKYLSFRRWLDTPINSWEYDNWCLGVYSIDYHLLLLFLSFFTDSW